MAEDKTVSAREVLGDFLNQGHLTYRVAGLASDYDRADAMIRDLAAEGIAILPRAELDSLRAALTRADAALYGCMVGGNHIASALIGRLGPSFSDDYPPTANHHEVLERMGAGDNYEMWCCWAAIMRARDAHDAARLSRAADASSTGEALSSTEGSVVRQNSVDDALALAAQRWADGECQLSPWGITQAALSLLNKEHDLHVRSWNVERDGDYTEALARAIRSCLEGYEMVPSKESGDDGDAL